MIFDPFSGAALRGRFSQFLACEVILGGLKMQDRKRKDQKRTIVGKWRTGKWRTRKWRTGNCRTKYLRGKCRNNVGNK